jgi:hypothetical protein
MEPTAMDGLGINGLKGAARSRKRRQGPVAVLEDTGML